MKLTVWEWQDKEMEKESGLIESKRKATDARMRKDK